LDIDVVNRNSDSNPVYSFSASRLHLISIEPAGRLGKYS
jgi:hypothetical protein